MQYELPSLNWILAFEASARLLSFTAAAREMNKTQTAISHQVRSLEKHLGFQLFERKAHGLALTDMGMAYMPSVRRALEDLSVSTAGLFGTHGATSVTVRAPISTAVLWLAPRMKKFAYQHPDINIRLCSALWADALAPEETDIDIRLGTGNWPGFTTELLRSEIAIPICAPSASNRMAEDISAFIDQPLIHIVGYEDFWMRAFHFAGLEDHDPTDRGITVDTTLAAIEIVASGYGFAMMLESLATDLIKADRIAIAADIRVPLDHAHYMLMPATKERIRPDVLMVRDWLIQEASLG